MVKISALPPMTTPDGADQAPFVDDSVSITKKMTLTQAKAWLQSLTQWITGGMLANGTIKNTQVDFTTSGKIWWEELGRTTLGSAGDTISVTGIPVRKYLRVQINIINTGATEVYLRFNNDTANNYALSYQFSSGSPGNLTNQNKIGGHALSASGVSSGTIDIVNATVRPKTGRLSLMGTLGSAGTAPRWDEFFFMWNNIVSDINRIDIINTAAGDFAAGAEIVVLGHD
jgi:hypothetical protein